MIIDARLAAQSIHSRPYTVSAAVANAIDIIKLHDALEISALLGQLGEPLKIDRLSTLVGKHKAARRFTVRQGTNGALATITRLA